MNRSSGGSREETAKAAAVGATTGGPACDKLMAAGFNSGHGSVVVEGAAAEARGSVLVKESPWEIRLVNRLVMGILANQPQSEQLVGETVAAETATEIQTSVERLLVTFDGN
ncbi:hypothetical protein F0562_017733 [Nyssa sinensis]|uniref:Uncharacterized protein n=1 Tax=Nyssa sinensis TaxID=561372 RepID=A0A5J4ZFY8_9ASTE|nr:hypothetical protein F0562_017733 [Nyssa sinensis]